MKRMRCARWAAPILGILAGLTLAGQSRALGQLANSNADVLDARGIEAIFSLNGFGVGLAMAETGRPGLTGFDLPMFTHPLLTPAGIFTEDNIALPNGGPNSHSQGVAGVVISRDPNVRGVSPFASFYASEWLTGDTDLADEESVAISSQHLALIGNRNGFRIFGVRAINHSYGVGPVGNPTGARLSTMFADWSARRFDALHVTAGDELGFAIGRNDLLAGWNDISVGFTRRDDMGFFTIVDEANYNGRWPANGRVLVDIVAPGSDIRMLDIGGGQQVSSGSSFAAPLVTGAVGTLQYYAQQQVLGMNARFDRDAFRHEVMKAVMMNSAEKREGVLGMGKTITRSVLTDPNTLVNPFPVADPRHAAFENIRSQPNNRAGDTMDWIDRRDADNAGAPNPQFLPRDRHPLDDQLGTGQLNITRAVAQFVAGEYDPGPIPLVAWDYHATGGAGGNTIYRFQQFFDVGDWVAVTLAWDRLVNLNDGMGGSSGLFDRGESFTESGFADLDLYLIPVGANALAASVARSTSTLYTVEHIFHQITAQDGAGMYEIWVRHAAGNVAPQDYALAWWAVVPAPGSVTLILGGVLLVMRRPQRWASAA